MEGTGEPEAATETTNVKVEPGPNKRKHRSFSLEFKLEVIAATEESSKRSVAKRFGIDAKRVREWCEQKHIIATLPQNRRRVGGAGRKPANRAIESELIEWIRQRHEQEQLVTRRMVQNEAQSLHRTRDDGNPAFKASDGWVTSFMRRHQVSLRSVGKEKVVLNFNKYLP
jgi:transposase-like protein